MVDISNKICPKGFNFYDWLHDLLSENESANFEAHLEDCKFCKPKIEGIKKSLKYHMKFGKKFIECQDEDFLIDYILGNIDEDRKEVIETHLSFCSRCKELLDEHKSMIEIGKKTQTTIEQGNYDVLRLKNPENESPYFKAWYKEFVESRNRQKAKIFTLQNARINPKYQEPLVYNIAAADSGIIMSTWPVYLELEEGGVKVKIELDIIGEYLYSRLLMVQCIGNKSIVLMCDDREVVLSDKYQKTVKEDDMDLLLESVDEIKKVLADQFKIKIL